MKTILKLSKRGGIMDTLYGLIGEKLGHSISPLIHSIVFDKLKKESFYHLFEVQKDELPTVVTGLKTLGAKGINVTIPYKTDIMCCLDKISDEAGRIGSVNTIQFTTEGTVGHNTDYFGLKKTFERYGVEIKDKKAVILGNGGVAITVVQLLIDLGISEITMVVRNIEGMQNKELFKELNIITYADLHNIKGYEILINTTPSGMYPNIDMSPIAKNELEGFKVVYDLIFNPKETLLLKYAKELGIKGINGLYMLVAQAVEAQKIWTSIDFSDEFLDEVFDEVEKRCGWL
jgi:shikimate dehydrogenase